VFDLTILNSYIILPSYCSIVVYQSFCLPLVQNLLEMSAGESHPQSTPRGKINPQASQVSCLQSGHTKHFPNAGSHLRCCMCSASKKPMATKFMCSECKVWRLVGLHVLYKGKLLNSNYARLWEGKDFQKCVTNFDSIVYIIFSFVSETFKVFRNQ
jgi:hypothetical protein